MNERVDEQVDERAGQHAGAGDDEDRVARVALGQLGEPGDLRMAGVVAELGAVEAYAQLAAGRDPSGLRNEVATRLAALEPQRDLELAHKRGFRFVVPGDDEWPTQVDDLDHAPAHDHTGRAPLGLWVRGPVRLDELAGSVAVVGSRSSTTYGMDIAAEIAATVALSGRVVVSGGAFGIDVAAHGGALTAGGRTVAVLACGVDRSYPLAHKPLFDHLAEHGAIVSELAPGRSPMRSRFLSRNRVIAALTSGTVVVEAALRSGALNTAGWVARLDRPLMGVPGPVTSAPSQGVHEMLRSGAAVLVTRGEEVLELVGAIGETVLEPLRGETRATDQVSKHDRRVLDAVPVAQGAAVDSIAHTAGLGLLEVRSALERLAEAGLARHDEDGWRLAAAAHH